MRSNRFSFCILTDNDLLISYAINSFFLRRGVDVENAIKLAAADDGFVTYDEIRENLRK